jgi:hypothetical protein
MEITGLAQSRDRMVGFEGGKGRSLFLIVVRFIVIGVILNLMVLTQFASGDELQAEATVDRNVVGVGESLVLTISISGASQVSEPDLSDIEGFTVVNTSRSQSISIVNFDMVRSLTLQYVLAAVTEGDYVLGPFKVKSGKETYETEPIKVSVVPGQAPPPAPPAGRARAGDDETMLLRASVDQKRAYVGEQITYNVKFAYRVRPHDVQYTPPEHTGFWIEDLGETGPKMETIDGKQYYVVDKKSAFFPISGGTYTIGPATVVYRISQFRTFSFDPFDMSGGKEGRVVTEPIDITVRPLPAEGRPSDFKGAVGRFDLAVTADSRKVKVGESLTLSVVISGQGNIKSIGDIEIPAIDGFRVFTPKARESREKGQTEVGGRKTFDVVLVPERTGDRVIDGFEFSYFDPHRERYVTLRADPIKVTVLPGEAGDVTLASGGSPEGTVARRDIRHIRRVTIGRNDPLMGGNRALGFALRFAPILVGIVGIIVSANRRRAALSGRAVLNKAYKAAMADLKGASVLSAGEGGAVEASARAARAVRSYLATLAGMSETVMDQLAILCLGDLEQDLKRDLAGLLGELDLIRFAPSGSRGTELRGLIERARALLKRVNAECDR